MSYTAAVDQLNSLAPELYTQPGQQRRKFSLAEIGSLLAALGDPQLRFPSVLIAGTNGKGSTAATLASILTASGVRAGLFTSPHLSRVNERIRIGREEIGDDAFGSLFFRVRETGERLVAEGRLPQLPSFFEILTAEALLYFAQEAVEIAVLEAGMGGRLDATNIVEPLLSVITDISLDHTEWLGETIAAIAREKAGILRKNGILVTLSQHPDANRVLGEVASELGVRGVNAGTYMAPPLAARNYPYIVDINGDSVCVDSPLQGTHQQRNLALAIAAAVELGGNNGFPVTAKSIEAGIRDTVWPGRLERIECGDGLAWILDVAHNPAGAWALRSGVGALLGELRPRTLVFSCLRDKPLAEMAQILFSEFDLAVFAPIRSPRAAAVEDLVSAARRLGVEAIGCDSVGAALDVARERSAGGAVVVSGSVYLVGEARSLLLERMGRQS